MPQPRMCAGIRLAIAGIFSLTALADTSTVTAQQVSGEQRRWHEVTLSFQGPTASETGTPNPFFDYRLDITWTAPSGRTLVTPGYFAADGDAAETSADQGDVWRAHFVPDELGDWSYTASFLQGLGIAAASDAAAAGGTPTAFDGTSGVVTITESDKSFPDFRQRGLLRYVGRVAPRFAGTDEPFLELGVNSPENILAFHEIDNTVDLGGDVPNFLHTFAPHVQDFQNLGGGPVWQGDKGEGLFGILNYFRSEGLNSVFLLAYTGHGDCDDVWPFLGRDEPTRYDCSKLDQWQRFFSHSITNGVHIQLTLTETENEAYFELTGTDDFFDDNRKVYHRELVARFGHHLALTWNLGEENGWSAGTVSPYRRATTEAQRRAFSEQLRALDPYDHPIVVHTHHSGRGSEGQDGVLGPLCDPLDPAPAIEGASLQGPHDSIRSVTEPSADPALNNHAKVREWVECSRTADRPWIVGMHEQRPSVWGAVTDGFSRDPNHDLTRKDVLWGTLFAGGTSVQHYFGYNFLNSTGNDINVEDFRFRADLWRQTRVVRDFFLGELPWTQMLCMDELCDDPFAYVFTQPTEVYAVYLRQGGTANLDLSGVDTLFTVQWFDPRNGGALQTGSVTEVLGGGTVALGDAPSDPMQDWVVLLRNTHRLPGTACADTRSLNIAGSAVVAERFEVTIPATATEVPFLLLGVEFPGPFGINPFLICDGPPVTPCLLQVDPLVTVQTGVASVLFRVGPSLIGTKVRLQGVLVDGTNSCLRLTEGSEIQILAPLN